MTVNAEDERRHSLSLSAEKRGKKREAGNAATKDNNCPAGGQRELLRRRTMLSPPGVERRTTKLCPVLHEDWLVLHEVLLFTRPRAVELPPPARRAVCLHLGRYPPTFPMPARDPSLLPRTHLHLEKPTEFLFCLDGTDPKTKRLLSCQLSGTKSRRRRLAGEKTNSPKEKERKEREGECSPMRACVDLSRQQQRNEKKKKKKEIGGSVEGVGEVSGRK